jgi:hypothetical protein
VYGGIKAHNAQKKLENTPTPTYTPSKSINDYYQESLNRYSASPYASMMYQNAQNRIAQSQAGGINALQDRRSGIGGIGAVVGQGERALGQAGSQAEQVRQQDFSMLGRAAGMQSGENQTGFQYNQLLPYQKRMSIFGAQASAGNQMMNAGLQNAYGGFSSAAEMGAFKGSQTSVNVKPYATYDPSLANTGGGYQSPASQTPYIDSGLPTVIDPYSSSVMAG